MPRRPHDKTYPYRTRERMQWRPSRGQWVGRVVTFTAPGERAHGPWMDLGNDEASARLAYDRWLATGEPPSSERGRVTFRQASEEHIAESEAAGDDKIKDRRTRLRAFAYPVIGALEVRFIEPHNVHAVLRGMVHQGKSAGYCLKMRSDISAVLGGLVTAGALGKNVALGVALPERATTDSRPRMELSDAEWLLFRERRGFNTQIDVMALLARDVGGHRGSDACAARWQDVDREHYAWMRVRRPKTDPETGKAARPGGRRHYELVEHGVPEHVRPVLAAWHERLGRPEAGPLFPRQRAARTGPVRLKDGRTVVRVGGEAGTFKRDGAVFARLLRRAVWQARIYSPLPGFDPARPDPALCAFQTDTATSRRLGFHTLRAQLATALGNAGVNEATSLGILGHTQMTTQLRHYMKKRRVQVPDAALPGGAPAPAAPAAAPELAAMVEAAVRAALGQQGAEGQRGQQGAEGGAVGGRAGHGPAPAPRGGASFHPQTAPAFGDGMGGGAILQIVKSSESLASPRGIEPLTGALGMRASSPKDANTRVTTPSDDGVQHPSESIHPQPLGMTDPLEAVRAAAAAAVAAGDWSLADKLRALITPPPPADVPRLGARRRKG